MNRDHAPTSIYSGLESEAALFYVVSSDGYSYGLPAGTLPESYSIGDFEPNLHRPAFSLSQVDISDSRPKTGYLTFKGTLSCSSEAEAIVDRQALKHAIREAAWFSRGDGYGSLALKVGRGSVKMMPSSAEKLLSHVDFVAKVIPVRVEDLDSIAGGWF